MPETQQPSRRDGQILEQVLLAEGVPPEDIKPLLAWLEQQGRLQGDLAQVQEVRAYRAKHNLL